MSTRSEFEKFSRLAAAKLRGIEAEVPVCIRKALADLPVGSRLMFYTTGKGSLGGLTPPQALRAGKLAKVKQTAEGYLER